MSYGQRMREWEEDRDRIAEERWLDQLTCAIQAKNISLARSLMVTGIANGYSFPSFTLGTWQSILYNQVLEEES